MPLYLDEARPRFDVEQQALAGAGHQPEPGPVHRPATGSLTRRFAAVVTVLSIGAGVVATNTTDGEEQTSARLTAESVDRRTPPSRQTPPSRSSVTAEGSIVTESVVPHIADASDPPVSGSARPEQAGPEADLAVVGPDQGAEVDAEAGPPGSAISLDPTEANRTLPSPGQTVDVMALLAGARGSSPGSTPVVTAPSLVEPAEAVPTPSPPAPSLLVPQPTASSTVMPSSASTVVPSSPVPATAVPSTAVPSTAVPSTAVPGQAGEVIWRDDFNRLDTSRWALEHSTYGDGNNELQCYRPENVSVAGGRLILRAVTETATCPNGSTRQVTSGMVRSRGVRFEPGQAIEFRVKLTPADPANQGGLWPAVWSSGWAGGGWPRGGEVDYFEVMTATDPTRSIYSIHYAKPDGSHGVTNKPVFGQENFSAAWHTVRFEYGVDGELTWYLDGRQVHHVNGVETVQGYPAPFDRSIGEIKMNLALGGRPGALDPRALGSAGATFEIDYIRVVRL